MGKKYIEIDGKKVYVKEEVAGEEKDEEETDETEENDTEETDENKGDDEDENEEKLAGKIASKIAKSLSELNKAREDDEEKKSLVIPKGGKIKVVDRDVKIYTTRRSGKDITIKQSEMENLSGWFKSFLNKNRPKISEYHQKLEPLVEGTNADGGFLVPTLLSSIIIDILEDAAVVKPRANVIDMTGMKTNQLNIDGIATKPIVQWGSENAAKSTSSMTFNQIGLTPYKLAAIVTLSTELRDDSPFNVVQLVSKAFADAVAKAEDQAFMTGNGTGRPTGIDNYTFTTVNAGNAISFDHLVSAYWKLPQAYRQRAFWIMNGRTIEAISTLKDSNNRHLLLDQGILTEPGIPTIKGRPVLEQNDVASSKIFFGDLSAYFIGQKLPMTIDVSEEATVAGISLWERNLVAVRIEERIDGELSTTRSFVEISNTGVS